MAISFAFLTVFFFLWVVIAYPYCIIFDKNRHALHYCGVLWAKTFLFINPIWKFTVLGKENLPKNGRAVVFVANHKNDLDILAIYMLGMRFRWLLKRELLRIPILGWGMALIGYVPVKRDSARSRKQCMEDAKVFIDKGIPMLFFPEGTRVKDPDMKPFKLGAFRLAHDAKVPVIPISIVGTNTLFRPGSYRPQKGQVRIVVHPAISWEHATPQSLCEEAQASIARSLKAPMTL